VTVTNIGGMRRRAVSVGADALVHERAMQQDAPLPWLITPARPGVDLLQLCEQQREHLEATLLKHAAILFRGFDLRSAEQFERVIAALSSGALEYQFRASPRTRVAGNIYTSTDYPADEVIFPHNEHSYSPRFPLRLFFFCETPAAEGGETPIGSNRAVLQQLRPELVEKFRQKRVLYVRNYGDGLGLPWQTVFQTEDRSEVDAYCASVGIRTEWKSQTRLRTEQIGPAIARHPRTGEDVWFNHATFFHVTTLPERVQAALTSSFGERDLPTNTFYGDGSPIEQDVLEELRGAYRAAMVKFPWQRGDMLFVDNMLCAHGREPFAGARKILTGMAEPWLAKDL
jgi:alpha-ketoglutarate-dependent taurine dioxygenase